MSDNKDQNSTPNMNFDFLKNLNIPTDFSSILNNLDMSQLQSIMSNFNPTNENSEKMKEQAEAMLSRLNLSPESIDNIRNQFESMFKGFSPNNTDQGNIKEQVESLFSKLNIPPEVAKNAGNQFESIMSMFNQNNQNSGDSKEQPQASTPNMNFSPDNLANLAGQIQSMFSAPKGGENNAQGIGSQIGSLADKLKTQFGSISENFKTTPINVDLSSQIDTLLSLMNIPDENKEKVKQQFMDLSSKSVLNNESFFKPNSQISDILGNILSSMFNQKK